MFVLTLDLPLDNVHPFCLSNILVSLPVSLAVLSLPYVMSPLFESPVMEASNADPRKSALGFPFFFLSASASSSTHTGGNTGGLFLGGVSDGGVCVLDPNDGGGLPGDLPNGDPGDLPDGLGDSLNGDPGDLLNGDSGDLPDELLGEPSDFVDANEPGDFGEYKLELLGDPILAGDLGDVIERMEPDELLGDILLLLE